MTLLSSPPVREALEARYEKDCASGRAIAAHLPALRRLAMGCRRAVEFGVKRGQSSCALLLGADEVVSYDLIATPEARALKDLVGARWSYRIEDSRTADVPPCDLLFVDALHTYDQVRAELTAHADKVSRTLVFHDTITFGSIGAKGESGDQLWTYEKGYAVPRAALGIRLAIDELMMRDRTWQIVAHDPASHGLLVLERPR